MGASGASGLAGYLVKRLLGMLLLLAGVTFVVFGMMYLAPGDVTVMLAASSPSPEQVAAIRREFGLDQPPWVQYGMFLRRVAHGDLGDSWIDRRPVMPQVLDAFGYTIRLAAVALGLSVVLGTAGGIVSAVRYRSATDESILSATLLGISVPVFVTGLVVGQRLAHARRSPRVCARQRSVDPSGQGFGVVHGAPSAPSTEHPLPRHTRSRSCQWDPTILPVAGALRPRWAWWAVRDSNPRHPRCKRGALTN